MKRITKRIFTGLLSLAIFACSTSMVFASNKVNSSDQSTSLDVEVGIDKKLEVPLTVDAKTDVFYNCPNINPGDTMKSTVIYKNTSKEDVQVAITDVLNQLTEDKKAIMLLDLLELKVYINGELAYQGPHSKVTTPLTNWITLKGGESIKMDIEIYFPKEADNTYQNSNMKVKWVFEARADVPPDPEEPTPTPPTTTTTTPPEKVKTGDDSVRANYGMYLLAGAAVILVAGIGVVALKKKKEDE